MRYLQRTQPGSKQRTRRGIIPANGGMSSQSTGPRGKPKPVPNYQDPTPLPHLAQDGLTMVLPVVTDLTQELPRVSPSELLPVHQHTDPVPATALAGTLPLPVGYMPTQYPGRQVLSELSALPDPTLQLAPATMRINAIKALGGPEPQVKDPARRTVVRLFRAARDMQRLREARAKRVLDKADECSQRMREFGEKWDEKLRADAAAVYGFEAVSAEQQMIAAYEEGRRRIAEENARRAADGLPPLDTTPTAFTKEMRDELKQLLVQRALSGTAVSA